MSLLMPETGLVFWMLLAFGTVFFILAKFAFPAITGAVDKRKEFIDKSIVAAKQANEQLANVKAEGEKLTAMARDEKSRILATASKTGETIVSEARTKAEGEGRRILDEARRQIETEKEDAVRDIRAQVAMLSIDIAEKLLREQLDDHEKQAAMIERMLDEVKL